MKGLISVIFAVIIFTGIVQAEPVTPYGDFCTKCSRYGYCKKPLSKSESIEAIKAYYENKGLNVEIARFHGRFIKVHVYKDDKLVDIVIFDRHTGRLRSIR